MKIAIRLFGQQARAVNARMVELKLPGNTSTCRALVAAIPRSYPALAASLPTCRVAINHGFAGDDDLIVPGDEVALIGPVSGG